MGNPTTPDAAYQFSVIVTTEHEEESLLALLGAIAAQDLSPNLYEMIVTDYSPEPREEAVAKFAADQQVAVRYFKVTGARPFEARNVGLRKANGQIAVLTDDDCLPRPDWLTRYQPAFEDPNVGMAGGPDKAPRSVRPFLRTLDYVLTSFAGTAGMRGGSRASGEYYPRTWNMALSKEALRRVGIFDEKLPGAQEFDLAVRLRGAGYSIAYLPECLISHRRDTDFRGHWASSVRASLGRAYVTRVRSCPIRPTHALPAVAATSCLGLLLAGAQNAVASATLAALASLYATVLVASGAHAAFASRRWYMLPAVPAVMALQHLAHAVGFAAGFAMGSMDRLRHGERDACV